jgi:uncharacterized membrane protein YdjX (TVP38/TMEM64 family)
MKFPKITHDTIYKIITIVAIILTVAFTAYAVIAGRQYFTRHGVRVLATQIKQFGILAPFAIIGLLILCTLVPPIPIPTPLIEMVAGTVFGFWPGVLLIWVAQMLASIAAYVFSKYLAKYVLKKIMAAGYLDFYQNFLNSHGAWAVFVIRATLSAPFNISFLAGLMNMPFMRFFWGTAFGVLTESMIFPYIGTLLIGRVRFRLWYVLVILAVLGVVPLLITMVIKLIKKKKNQRDEVKRHIKKRVVRKHKRS